MPAQFSGFGIVRFCVSLVLATLVMGYVVLGSALVALTGGLGVATLIVLLALLNGIAELYAAFTWRHHSNAFLCACAGMAILFIAEFALSMYGGSKVSVTIVVIALALHVITVVGNITGVLRALTHKKKADDQAATAVSPA